MQRGKSPLEAANDIALGVVLGPALRGLNRSVMQRLASLLELGAGVRQSCFKL